MAACVATVIVRLWQAGTLGRLAIAPLVLLQVVWGGDHYFLPTHAMLGQQPLKATMDLLSAGFGGRYAERFQISDALTKAGQAVPRDAHVLVHEQHVRLGLGRQAVSDSANVQGGISYRRARSPRDAWRLLHDLGVTHVLWPAGSNGVNGWADEAVFYDLATRYLPPPAHYDGMSLAPLGDRAPPETPFGPVAIFGCQLAHRVALPEVDQAIHTATSPPDAARVAELARDAGFVLVEASCRPPTLVLAGYDLVTTRSGWQTWARR
jgi:hypothetical protein